MRAPQVLICAPDDWLANQLGELLQERKWLLQQLRKPSAVVSCFRPPRPLVLLLQLDVTQVDDTTLSLIPQVSRINANAAVIVVVDVKLPEEERASWTASLMDLGARLVLFPPLTKPVLEDAVGGLMETLIERLVSIPGVTRETVVDLAYESGTD